MQEQRKERTGSWQSQSQRRWTWSSYVSTSSSIVQNPVASKSLGILKAPCRTDWLSTGKLDAKEDNQDAALSSQGLQKDAVLDGCRYEETGRFRKLRNRRQWQSLATQSPCINRLRTAHGEGFLDRGQRYGLCPMNQMKNLYFCLSLFKPQFILEQTIRRICDLPGINPRNHWERVFWKPVNPQDCVWKNLHQIFMRTILQDEGTIHYNIRIWYTNLILCLEQWTYPQQKQQWIINGRNFKRLRRGTWQKSEVRKRWWSKDVGKKSSFCLTEVHLSFEECRIGGKAPKI